MIVWVSRVDMIDDRTDREEKKIGTIDKHNFLKGQRGQIESKRMERIDRVDRRERIEREERIERVQIG